MINDYGGPFAGAEILTLTMRDGLRARGHEARLLASTAPLLPGENVAEYRCRGTVSRLQPLLEAFPLGTKTLPASLPSILLHVAARGAGEAAAYLTGSDGDGEFLVAHEFSQRPEGEARS